MTTPPWLRWLVTLLAPAGEVEELLGDLEEVHRARLESGPSWKAQLVTTRDAFEIVAHLGLQRIRRGVGRGLFTALELRLALRLLRRSPIVSVTVVVALAVGITLATTGFTVVRAVLDTRLPFAEGPRVVELSLLDARTAERRALEPGLLPALTGEAGTSGSWGVATTSWVNLASTEQEVERVRLVALTPDGFAYALPPPLLGRPLPTTGPGEGPRPALLSEPFWTRRFGADRSVLGSIVEVGGAPHRISGVLPKGAGFPAVADVWTVLDPDRDPLQAARIYGVLSVGTGLESAEDRWSARFAAAARDAGLPAVDARLQRVEDPAGAGRQGLVVLGFLVGFLVIVAGNVGNLMVARAASRTEELRIRTALGARRSRLIGQLALEASLLVSVAALVGVTASQRLLASFQVSEAQELPPWIDLGLHPAVVLFVVGLGGLLTVVAGVVPGARATRGLSPQLASRGPLPRAFGWGHSVMIVALITLSVGVLGGAGLVNRAWSGGFDLRRIPLSDAITTSWVELPGSADGDVETQGRLLEELQTSVRSAHPGARVAFSSSLPGIEAPLATVQVEGMDLAVVAPVARVSPEFYSVLGADARTGILPGDSGWDRIDPATAVVDEAFVERRLEGGNAVGRRLRLAGSGPDASDWYTITAVVPELGLSGMDPDRAGGIYLPLTGATTTRLLVRGTGDDPLALGRTLPQIAYGVDPEITVSRIHTLSGVVGGVRRVFQGLGAAFTGLGGVVLVLALMGVYAILSFEVTRRRKEIGIRVALGAAAPDVLRPLLLRVGGYVAAGTLLGTFVAAGIVAVTRAMVQMRLPGTGLPLFAGLALVVFAAAASATLVPARRALKVPPGEVLQGD